jgi:NADP-dependent 3-hydroxy acid dehydrogenase YdfG
MRFRKLMNLTFENKVALVTGAASGMGLATAKAFAEAGAAVVLADFKEEAVKVEVQKFAAAGHKAIAIRCDVSDDDQVAAMWVSKRSFQVTQKLEKRFCATISMRPSVSGH